MASRIVSPGESVRDELLEVVADLDADLADPRRPRTISTPLSLPFCADAASAVLEHLDGVFADVAVRLEGRDRGDDDDVAGGRLQRADAAIELGARSPASMTWAKSLTGAVSAGGGGCAAAASQRDEQQTSSSHERRWRATAASCGPATCRRIPRSVRRRRCSARERRRLGDRARCAGAGSEDLAHQRRGMPICALRRVAGDRRRVAASSGEPGDVAAAARGTGRPTRRPAARSPRVAARLDEAFAQVDQVALGLHLARAPEVLRRDRERRRTDRRRPRRRGCAMISPYSSGKTSSERSELVAREHQRHRQRRRGASRRERRRRRRGRAKPAVRRARACAGAGSASASSP